MNAKSRTYNSIVNSLWGIVASIITTILNFVVRVVLVKSLGEEINGLHNLFQSIISVMALMEMGLNTAMIIHLYAPLKEGNNILTGGIISFYRKLYRLLAFSFLAVGVLISFTVLNVLVTSSIPIGTVRVYFILFVLSFSIGFLTNYRRCILFAEQKNRVSIISTTFSELVFRSVQIVTLFYLKNYYLFLFLLICERICNNSICNYYVIKHHPYLKNLSCYFLEKKKKIAIFRTVKPLFVNQMANTVQMSTRSILISILLGNVSVVGYFGNYQLVMSVIQLVYGQFGGAFTSSFGNLSVGATADQLLKVYRKSAFVMNWVAAIGCSVFICCTDTFIYLVFGSNFVLEELCVIILTLNLIIYLLNIPIISVQNALGLHKIDSNYMIIQAATTIGMGFVFGKLWEMSGIFIGILVPLFVFTFILKGILISRHSLGISGLSYLSFALKELCKVTFTVATSYFICKMLLVDYSIITLIASLIVALFVGAIMPLILSFKQSELSTLTNLLTNKRK